jgi:hypothetical protein
MAGARFLCLLATASTVVAALAADAGSAPNVVLDFWLVPHAHCDVGWIDTPDAYYNNSVQHILTTVTKHLAADEGARFIWSETFWLSLWWPQQSPETQALFRLILRRKQFEFVGGKGEGY